MVALMITGCRERSRFLSARLSAIRQHDIRGRARNTAHLATARQGGDIERIKVKVFQQLRQQHLAHIVRKLLRRTRVRAVAEGTDGLLAQRDQIGVDAPALVVVRIKAGEFCGLRIDHGQHRGDEIGRAHV